MAPSHAPPRACAAGTTQPAARLARFLVCLFVCGLICGPSSCSRGRIAFFRVRAVFSARWAETRRSEGLTALSLAAQPKITSSNASFAICAHEAAGQPIETSSLWPSETALPCGSPTAVSACRASMSACSSAQHHTPLRPVQWRKLAHASAVALSLQQTCCSEPA